MKKIALEPGFPNLRTMLEFSVFQKNLGQVQTRIAKACEACSRPAQNVRLLPVTKTHPVEASYFARRAGLLAVGENRVQEAVSKRPQGPPDLRWELIGHLQSNKTRLAVATFDRIQSLDSPELARRLASLCAEAGKVMPVLLQANAGADAAKSGAVDFDALRSLADVAFSLPQLRVEGLMTIPPLNADSSVARRSFETLRSWRDRLEAAFGKALPELSMGMSSDIEAAIAAGSTQVRVGTALFGSR
ncbi:MAG: YggS family pyridoxal phosphate-dependent enzyme [Puniceicoccales bacterium]|nr:YggS family pyridoxal phosphate-dependent enzyme [Puniceicoccales bacterium]